MALDADNKKKVMLLAGLAGLLGIAGLAVLQPWRSADSSSTEVSTAVVSNSATAGMPPASSVPATGSLAPIPAPNNGAMGAESAPLGVASAAANAPQLIAAEESRNDPFEQYYTIVPNLPTPPPPPPTPRPTPTPLPPIPLPSPEEATGRGSVALPGTPSADPSPILVGLPSPRISRYLTAPTQPRIQTPPPSFSGGSTVLARSSNKRLAGVVIGDSVRALLEIDDGSGEPVTRVVQPGDEVEGVRILRIERYTEGGGRNRVRLIVRENGEERAVELRASANPLPGPGGVEGGAGIGGIGRGGLGGPPLP